jgi:MoaA/NifB/PqqE/SkfB family radical SAM enzyme
MFRDSFCSSPWFHLRVLPNGNYNVCRWASSKTITKNISNTSLIDFYNGEEMSNLRLQLLNGETPDICKSCQYQDKFDKLSGRKKQLLKSGITDQDFELKTRCSPHYEYFKHSLENIGESNYFPNDFQIDLGNVCNSGCIMCEPRYSSRLAQDYKILSKNSDLFFEPPHYDSWTNSDELVEKFVKELKSLPKVKYIHLLGGETLYMKSFYKICDALIENDLAKETIIGTTTNATIYNEKIEKYINTFKQFHLGISIETVTDLNDYIRYPSKINQILDNIQKYKKLDTDKLFLSLRITPNIFTIYELDLLADFMVENNITAESCNILKNPSMLRMELLPNDIRNEVIEKISKIIIKYNFIKDKDLVNTRNKNYTQQTIGNNIIEYFDFIKNYSLPENIEQERYNLVKFLKAFEHLRNNKITDYAPRYTKFLTDYGY